MPDAILECDDSPLSTVANVIGILTFALAVGASSLAFITVFLDAGDEINYYKDILSKIKTQVENLEQYFLSLKTEANPDFMPYECAMKTSSGDLLEAHDKISNNLTKASHNISSYRILGRLQWWRSEKEIRLEVGRLESQKTQFTTMLLIFLSRCVFDTDIE